MTINTLRGRPVETFVIVGKAGTAVRAYAEAIGRLVSLALRWGVPVPEICRQLRNISSDRSYTNILSLPDGLAQVLEEHHG